MGILSSAVSITRYRAEGKIEGSVMETIAKGLKKNAILEIDEDAVEKATGWTSFETRKRLPRDSRKMPSLRSTKTRLKKPPGGRRLKPRFSLILKVPVLFLETSLSSR